MATEAETFYFILFVIYAVIDEDEDDTDDAMEVHFGLRLLDRAADHACSHYPVVN